jgi:preprotein translocase subunit SecD
MNPNLRWKVIFIALVVLLCAYGLFGLPTLPTSAAQLRDNFSKRIKLGLDLQGGTHLILQVQVNEAVSQQTDQVLDHLTMQLREKNIRYDEVRKLGDTQILVHNLAPESTAAFRDLVSSSFPDWDISPAPGETSGYVLTVKPSVISVIQQQTMSQSEDTIRRRIDALGLTEPFVAPYGQGDNEIIVELPGEGDPNRAKSVIQAGGQLELRRVEDTNPYPSETAALAAHGGVLPPQTELVGSKTTDPSGQGGVYLLDRALVITGRDLRSATALPSTDYPGFYAFDRCSAPLRPFHRAEHRPANGDRSGP